MKTIEISILEEITLKSAIHQRKDKLIKFISADNADEMKNLFIRELAELVSVEKKIADG